MMLIVVDKKPNKAVDYLIKHTNKNFCFKQLLELGQLICSCGISDVYKKINQGKLLQEWIKKNKLWIYRFMTCLWIEVVKNINIKPKTMLDLYKIRQSLFDSIEHKKRITYPKTAIFRYKKGYECEYESNSELPIDVAVEEYKKYLEWKFKGDSNDIQS